MSATIGNWWLLSTDALPGEEVLFTKVANRTQSTGRAVGGKLFVTNFRIIFLPHLFDGALGGEKLLLPLAQVRAIDEKPAGGDTFGGGLRKRLMIVHTGGAELFVVNKLPTVIETMRRLCFPAGRPGPYPGSPPGASAAWTQPAAQFPATDVGASPPSRHRRWVRIGAIAAVAVGFTGYNVYRDVHGNGDFKPVSHGAQVADTTCPVQGAQTLTMTKNSADEPAIHIPVRPGWEEHDYRNDAKIKKKVDVSYVRGTIVNTGLRDNGYTPSIEAILEGDIDPDASAQTILGEVFGPIQQTAGSVTQSTETICGATIYRADYTGLKADDKNSESGTLLVAITDAHRGPRWLAGVKLATAAPENPEYLAERDALLKGFHITTSPTAG